MVAVHVVCDYQPVMALRIPDTIAVIIILGRGADERALCAELRAGFEVVEREVNGLLKS